MLKKKVVFILIIFLGSFIYPNIANAQTNFTLVLRKNKKRIYYFKKNTIEIKLKDTSYIGIVNNIHPDSCQIDSVWIKYGNIDKVIDRNVRHFIKNGSTKFPLAGISFALLTALNAIIQSERPIFLREHLFPSTGLVVLGGIMFPFRNKKYNLKRNWQLIVIPE